MGCNTFVDAKFNRPVTEMRKFNKRLDKQQMWEDKLGMANYISSPVEYLDDNLLRRGRRV